MKKIVLIFSFLISLTPSVWAVDCDAVLSAPALDSTIEAPLSNSARAYLRLVTHYATKLSEAEAEKFITKLIQSEASLNPFTYSNDTFAGQLSAAIKSILSRITQEDWQKIRAALKELADHNKVNSADRAEKKEKTSLIFNPIEILKENFENLVGQTFDLNVINGRTIISFVTSDKADVGEGILHLYEFKNEQLHKLTEESVNSIGDAKFAWHSVGDRAFFTFVNKTSLIKVYELIENTLVSLEDVFMKSELAVDVKFRAVGEKIYFYFGDAEGLKLFELIDENFTFKISFYHDYIYSRPEWHTIDGREYISFTSLKNSKGYQGSVYLLEVVNDEFLFWDRIVIENGVQRIEFLNGPKDETLLSAGFIVGNIISDRDLENLRFYKILNGKLGEIVVPKQESKDLSEGAMQFKKGDMVFSAKSIGSLLALRRTEDNFNMLGLSAYVENSDLQTWQEINGREFSVSFKKRSPVELTFLELIEGRGLARTVLSYGDWTGVPSTLKWALSGDESYGVFSMGNAIHVIKIFSSVEEGKK